MTISLLDAVAAVDRRLYAVDEDPIGARVAGNQIGLIATGFDLDAKEVQTATAMAAIGMVRALTAGSGDVYSVARGVFFNGILTGLILAEIRQREAVTANAD